VAAALAPGGRVTVTACEWFTKVAAAPSWGPEGPETSETPGFPKRVQLAWLTFWNSSE
jgi:hypothetical protein